MHKLHNKSEISANSTGSQTTGSVQETGLQGNSITNGYTYFLEGFLSAPVMKLTVHI